MSNFGFLSLENVCVCRLVNQNATLASAHKQLQLFTCSKYNRCHFGNNECQADYVAHWFILQRKIRRLA